MNTNKIDKDKENKTNVNYDPFELYESDDEGDIIYPLNKPFNQIEKGSGKSKNQTVEVDKLIVRPPNGSDLRATQDLGPQESAYIQVQRCARLKPQSFDKLATSDILEISNIVNFLAEA